MTIGKQGPHELDAMWNHAKAKSEFGGSGASASHPKSARGL
jgi:hypothetical protein